MLARVPGPEILMNVGQIFDKISRRFSLAEVPLVYEVLPMLARLRRDLMQVKDDVTLPNIVRIAAMASLLILEKYDDRYEQTEVYRIAVGRYRELNGWGHTDEYPAVLHPSMKLKWFEQRQWGSAQISAVEQLVRTRWAQDYASQMVPTTLNVPESKVRHIYPTFFGFG